MTTAPTDSYGKEYVSAGKRKKLTQRTDFGIASFYSFFSKLILSSSITSGRLISL